MSLKIVNLDKLDSLERVDKMGKKQKTKKVKRVKKTSYQFGDLGKAIYKYFTDKGLDKVNYEESKKIALSTCPHSKYGKSHFAWYKAHFKKYILPTLKK